MKGVLNMADRLAWDDIKRLYPSQWVGLTDCEMKDDINIISAVVKVTEKDMTSDEMALETIKGHMVARYTTPEDVSSVGALMI